MIFSVVFEVVLIMILIYVPGLNSFFMLDSLTFVEACEGMWFMPIMLFYDEIRKFFIRRNPKGLVARLTLF